jgi:hypothetical protein
MTLCEYLWNSSKRLEHDENKPRSQQWLDMIWEEYKQIVGVKLASTEEKNYLEMRNK